METKIIKHNCDHCNIKMSKSHYEASPTLTLQLSLPNPKGGCGNFTGVRMTVCEDCCKKIGLINDEEYHKYTYSQGRLKSFLKNNKKKILNFILGKDREEK